MNRQEEDEFMDTAMINSIQAYNQGYGQAQGQSTGQNSALNQRNNISESVSMIEIDTTDILETIQHLLKGEVQDQSGNFISKYNQVLSDEEINELMLRLYSKTHRGFTLSEFNENEIKIMAYEIAHEINKYFFIKLLTDPETSVKVEHYKMLVQMLDHNVWANLKRALNGGERLHRERQMQIVEHRMQRQGQEKKSPLGMFRIIKNRMESQGVDTNGY